MLERKNVFHEIDNLMIEFCHDCFLYKHNRKEKGRCFAHQFCIASCTVGEKLKELGNQLHKNNIK